MEIKPTYLLFLGDGAQAKTARGIADWRPERCAGQFRLPGCRVDLGLPDMNIEQAVAAGAATLVIGVATHGGQFPARWIPPVVAALEAGLDVANGLHTRLSEIPAIRRAAAANVRRIFDVRHPERHFAVATGARRSGRRLLTVGTDCECGKMYTALAIEREMRNRGLPVDFRASGQTGILISGAGVSVDAVVADFISGAAEWLSPAGEPEHWDVIEGQGSLFHPAYAGVTLGLLHGSQPDALVMCHEVGRHKLLDYGEHAVPPLEECIAAYEQAARLTNPHARCIGLSLNTARLDAEDAAREIDRLGQRLGLACVDPVRAGTAEIVDALMDASTG